MYERTFVVKNPSFKLAFLAPKYWLTWLGVLFLYLISWFPQKIQIWLGRGLGKLVHKCVKKRRKIAEVNIKLCFPDMSEAEQAKLVKKNMENTGVATLETGMAWWWPNWRVKNVIGSIKGFEHVERVQADGKGVLLLVPHMLHLEMLGRIVGSIQPGVGFYRPHNNALMEYFMTRGRLRSNEALIGKKDVKGLLKSLKDTKMCYYLPDQDYGRNRCEFVPFYAVEETATTTGTLLFAASKHCEALSLSGTRDRFGKYHIEIHPLLENFPSGDDNSDVRRVNERMELSIDKSRTQYMWLHRRFKTRPDKDAPSYYK